VTEAIEAETSQRVLQALGIEVAGEPRIYEVTTNI
jgi:hypothetical protein